MSPDPLPFGLLFHQTLAALKGARRFMRFGDLCDEVLSLSPFSSVTREDYRLLLKHMINKRTLIQTEDLTLLIGPKAEPVAFGRDFSAVFEVRDETEIRAGGSTVGTDPAVSTEQPVRGCTVQVLAEATALQNLGKRQILLQY